MTEQLALHVGQPGGPAGAPHYAETSSRPFHDVLAALTRAIDAAGLKLLHEIDPQKALAGIGQRIGGSRLLFFFHPELVARVMRADVNAMVEAPLKLVATELPDGTVSLRMADPAAAFGRYDDAELTALGQELAKTCRAIIRAGI